MVDYMRAEWYKVFRRKYPYITILLLLAGEFLLVAGWMFTNYHGNDIAFSTGGGVVVTMLSVGLYASVLVGDMVFSEQYKFNTLKNEASYGLPRARIYLGKLLVAAILGVALSLISVVFYELLCWLTLLPGEPGSAVKTLELVGYCTLVALPQWLGMLSVSLLAFFLVGSSMVAAVITLVIIVLPQTVLKVMGFLIHPVFLEAAQWMPSSIVDSAQAMAGDWKYIALSWAIGAAWFAGATVIGLAAFRRKEIN